MARDWCASLDIALILALRIRMPSCITIESLIGLLFSYPRDSTSVEFSTEHAHVIPTTYSLCVFQMTVM